MASQIAPHHFPIEDDPHTQEAIAAPALNISVMSGGEKKQLFVLSPDPTALDQSPPPTSIPTGMSDDFGDFVDAPSGPLHAPDPLTAGPFQLHLNSSNAPRQHAKSNLVDDILRHEQGGLALFSTPVYSSSSSHPPTQLLPRASSSTSRIATPTQSTKLSPHDAGSTPVRNNDTIGNHTPAASAVVQEPSTPSPALPHPHSRPPPKLSASHAIAASENVEDETEIIAKHLGLIDDAYFEGREPAEALAIPLQPSRSRSRSSSSLAGDSVEGGSPAWPFKAVGRRKSGVTDASVDSLGGGSVSGSSTQTRTLPVQVAPPVTSSGGEWDDLSFGGGQEIPSPFDLDAPGNEESSRTPTKNPSYATLGGLWGRWKGSPVSGDGEWGEQGRTQDQQYGSPQPIQPTILEGEPTEYASVGGAAVGSASSGGVHGHTGRPLPRARPSLESIQHRWKLDSSPSLAPSAMSHSPERGSPSRPSSGGAATVKNPFATHKFAPIPGAPGFEPDRYDWDKGYSDELERELRGGGGGSRREGDRAKERERRRQAERHSGIVKENKEGGTALLYQTLGSKFGFGSWGSSSPSASRGGHARATSSDDRSAHTRSATAPSQLGPPALKGRAVSELIEQKVGRVELKARKESTSGVLSATLAELIRPHLPPLSRLPRSWTMLYSLDQHGISLKTLYSNCEAPEKQRKPGQPYVGMGGAIVVVRDAEADAAPGADRDAFGAFIAEGMGRKAKGFYGGGDSFLWKYDAAKNELKVFRPTGRNSYFTICDAEYIGFGGGSTSYGLWLDSSLLEGSSAPCPTFGNEVLCSHTSSPALSTINGNGSRKEVEFECVGLEIWGIGPT